MFELYMFSDVFTNGFRVKTINLISLMCILFGVFVIISKNPVVSVLFLIGLFSSISCYLIILGINFVGLSYLLVYIGAVSILFLFILMLINVRVSELISDTSNSIPLAIISSISFYYYMYQIIKQDPSMYNNLITGEKRIPYLTSEISLVSTDNWAGSIAEATDITSIGNVMYTSYSIWLIITSIILLLAMTGVIVVVIKNNNEKVSPNYKSK